MGGPASYDGRDLKTGHARLDIGANEFAAVVARLVTALQEASVPEKVIGRVGEALEATEADIVSTTAN